MRTTYQSNLIYKNGKILSNKTAGEFPEDYARDLKPIMNRWVKEELATIENGHYDVVLLTECRHAGQQHRKLQIKFKIKAITHVE